MNSSKSRSATNLVNKTGVRTTPTSPLMPSSSQVDSLDRRHVIWGWQVQWRDGKSKIELSPTRTSATTGLFSYLFLLFFRQFLPIKKTPHRSKTVRDATSVQVPPLIISFSKPLPLLLLLLIRSRWLSSRYLHQLQNV